MKVARFSNRGNLGVLAIVVLFGILLVRGASAVAAPPASLWDACFTGSGPGQCSSPRGIAASPSSGHLFISDYGNSRVVELTAWGEFVKAWGWGVQSGAPTAESCTQVSGCQQGIAGSGAGQLKGPGGLAVDSAESVYVVDALNNRIEKFTSNGDFVWTIGGGVNQTTGGDLCVAASGDICGTGQEGSGIGEFAGWGEESFIAVGTTDELYVGDHERIQVFDPSGNHIRNILIPSEQVRSLAVDPAGNIFVSYAGKSRLEKLSPSGVLLCSASPTNPSELATDQVGNVYVANSKAGPIGPIIFQRYDDNCQEASNYTFELGDQASVNFETYGIATNVVKSDGAVALYMSNTRFSDSFVRAYSPPPDKWPPPLAAPQIEEQFASAVGTTGATLRANINPRFWVDTTFYIEYGQTECSTGGCSTNPAPPGTQLTSAQVGDPVESPPVSLRNLVPGQTYFYRFVARSSGSGGQPVKGQGGVVGVPGTEGTFTTFPASASSPQCPNAVFRVGPSSALPLCRGYEMVSPIDKNGGGITVLDGFAVAGFSKRILSRIDQARPDGEIVTYSAGRAFPGTLSAPWSSQYVSVRGADGWATRSVNPPLGSRSLYDESARSQEIPFRAFSEDLCSSWILQQTNQPLSPLAPTELPNLYRQSICNSDGYEVLTSTAAPGFLPRTIAHEYLPQIQGFTADQAHSLFRVNGKLTPDAGAGSNYQLYETTPGGNLRLLSVLPSGKPSASDSSLGTSGAEGQDFHNDSVLGAISADGSRVFWTNAAISGSAAVPEPGEIYLRANPLAESQEAKGPCSEAGRACSLKISGPNSVFWAADSAGTSVLYQEIGATQAQNKLLKATITESEGELTAKSVVIASGVRGVLGASRSLARVYFTSIGELAPGATAGQPNVFLYEDGNPGTTRFIATLNQTDSHGFGQIYSADNFLSSFRHSRVSSSGDQAVFTSSAPLTGFDSTDAVSGEPNLEVFMYEIAPGASPGSLVCLSCNPSNARPHGQSLGRPSSSEPEYWSAAEIPAAMTSQYSPRVLSGGGSQIFFESYDGLLPRDTNGVKDVYEWRRASGEQQCAEAGAGMYVLSAGGCLSLISTGQSSQESEFIDASADGADVFFTTNQSLVSSDPGLVDLYDARVNGGVMLPSAPPSCVGESCQGPAGAVAAPTPTTTTSTGGNLRPGKCRKGKHKVTNNGKSRCVKNGKKKKSKARKKASKKSSGKTGGRIR